MANRGRPTVWTSEKKEIAQKKICDLLRQTKSLRQICRENDDLPSTTTIEEWLNEKEGDFSKRYARAKEDGIEAYLEEGEALLEEVDVDVTPEFAGVARVTVDKYHKLLQHRQWVASKLHPKYRDKSEVDANVKLSGFGELAKALGVTGIKSIKKANNDDNS